MFAWLRPNDLVWNYVVNNYLLGKTPPAFDVLYWNQDSVRLATGLHRDFVRLALDNTLARPGGLTLLGSPVDLGAVDVDSYIVAGLNDHIVPWENAYRATQLLGGRSRFVLSTSGHIQAMVNPPAPDSRSSYRVAERHPEDPGGFLETAAKVPGSWCPTTPSGWPRDRVSSSPRRSGSGGAATARTARRRAPTSSPADMSSFLPTRGVDSAVSATTARDLLWPPFAGPGDLARHRAGPARPTRASDQHLRARDAGGGAVARPHGGVGAFRRRALAGAGARHLRGAGRRRPPGGERARGPGVERRYAVAVVSVNCAELVPLLLAAEAVGIFAPINPALAAEHATELVRLAGARVIVASGPELDPVVWEHARAVARPTGADALLALRPTAPEGAAPAPAPLGSTQVAYLAERMAAADATALPGPPPAADAVASYLHTGGTTGTPKLAARTYANEVANAWMISSFDVSGPAAPSSPPCRSSTRTRCW